MVVECTCFGTLRNCFLVQSISMAHASNKLRKKNRKQEIMERDAMEGNGTPRELERGQPGRSYGDSSKGRPEMTRTSVKGMGINQFIHNINK